MKFACAAFVGLSAVAFYCNALFALPAPTYRTVALRGHQAPGLTSGDIFTSFFTPSINSAGEVCFSGTIEGPLGITSNNNTGIWTEGAGPLALLARENDPAAGGTAGEVYSELSGIMPNISDSGDVAWLSSLFRPPSTSFIATILKGNVGSVQMLASRGAQVPGLPTGVNYAAFNEPPTINAQGDVAYRARLDGLGVDGTNQWTLWKSAGGVQQLLARQGEPAPGTSASFGTIWSNRINHAGHVAVSADLSTIESGTTPESGLWLSDGTSLNLQVKDFSFAPGVPNAEMNISQGSSFSVNSSGHLAFRASMRASVPAGVDTTNDSGIWSSGSGSLKLLAREGSQAPGVIPDAKYASFDTPKLSEGGHTAFAAGLANDVALGITSTNNSGIWSDAGGILQLLARSGDQAPGMPLDAVFNTFNGGRSSVDFALNSAGHSAFLWRVTGGGTTSSNNLGLWAQDQNGNLRLVVRQGDMFEVAPGDLRLITGINFQSQSAGGEGLPRGLNDNYQIAIHLNFANNTSGIFVAQISVPEPGSLGLSLLAFAGIFARCKQRG